MLHLGLNIEYATRFYSNDWNTITDRFKLHKLNITIYMFSNMTILLGTRFIAKLQY